MFYLDTIIDFLFIFDMIVNFNSPIQIKDEQYDYNRKRVALNYLKTWFIIDLFASIPMNLISKYLIPPEVNLKG